MNLYELNLLIAPEISEEKLDSFSSELKDFGDLAGETKKEKRKLAYAIEDENNAWLLSFHLSLKGNDKKTSLEKLEKKLKEDKNVLRYLILSKKQLPQEPKPFKKELEKANLEKVDEKVEELLKEEV